MQPISSLLNDAISTSTHSAASSGSGPTTRCRPDPAEVCPICAGHGWLVHDVEPGHPLFGKLVPCPCRLAARRRELFTGALAAMTLESFMPLTPSEHSAWRAAAGVAANWMRAPDDQPAAREPDRRASAPRAWRSLLLYAVLQDTLQSFPGCGRPLHVTGCGCGKTHLAVSLAKLALDAGRDVRFITETELLREIRRSYAAGRGGDEADAPSEAAILAELARPWLLVLDDVGTAQVKSAGWYQDILYAVVNQRYMAGLPLVLTSNLDPDALEERLGPRTWSRLAAMAEIVCLDGPDRREMSEAEIGRD